MIRQAISCDICGAEKRQTNHWFVAYEQGGELRLSDWNSRNRLRPGVKHLCGQTCLHKLADDFMARAIAVRTPPAAADETAEETQEVETGAASGAHPAAGAVSGEAVSSARLLEPAAATASRAAPRAQTALVSMPGKGQSEGLAQSEDPVGFASHSRRAQAWERERKRTLYAVERLRSQA